MAACRAELELMGLSEYSNRVSPTVIFRATVGTTRRGSTCNPTITVLGQLILLMLELVLMLELGLGPIYLVITTTSRIRVDCCLPFLVVCFWGYGMATKMASMLA